MTKLKWIVIALGLVITIIILMIVKVPQKGRINVVLVSDSLTILSLEKEKGSINLMSIPDNAYIPVAFGKGQMVSSSLYKFDALSNKKGRVLTYTMREFLGIPVDGWIKISEKPRNTNDFLNLREQELSLFKINKTSLSPLAVRQLYYRLGQIRPDKISFTDLNSPYVFKKESLPDGSEVLLSDNISLDGTLIEKFYEWRILSEGFRVSVLNGTGTGGLAARAARILTNSGVNVVMTGENQTKQVNCMIYAPRNKQGSYTVMRFKKVFSCDLSSDIPEDSRSDITLVIGSNYEREVSGP